MKAIYPNFENVRFELWKVLSELMYALDAMYGLRKCSASWTKLIEIDEICHFVGLKKKRYIRYTLYLEFVIHALRWIRYGLCLYSR